MKLFPAVLLSVCLLPATVFADEEASSATGTAKPNGLTRMLDSGHDTVSKQVIGLGQRLDELFGGEQFDRGPNASYVRVVLTSHVLENDIDWDQQLRVRLALPNTEQRLRLVFQTEEDRDSDLPGEAPRSPVYSALDGKRSSNFITGLQYVRELADYWHFDTDVGVRLRARPRAFAQVRLGRSFFVGPWELRPTQSAFWRNEEGLGASTQFLAQRRLDGPRFFRSETNALWLNDDQRWLYSQDFVLSHEFTPLNAIQARAGGRWVSQPNTRMEGYFVNVGWRRNVYKDWLFAEVRPEVNFSPEGFNPDPGIYFVLETFFGRTEPVDPGPLPPAPAAVQPDPTRNVE